MKHYFIKPKNSKFIFKDFSLFVFWFKAAVNHSDCSFFVWCVLLQYGGNILNVGKLFNVVKKRTNDNIYLLQTSLK
jgi:hypothetical protein